MDGKNSKRLGRMTFERERGVTEVDYLGNLGHLVIEIEEENRVEQELKIYRAFGEGKISLFMIKLDKNALSFLINRKWLKKAKRIVGALNLPLQSQDHCAVVSVIASNIRNIPGVMSKIMQALRAAKIPVLQVGDSHDSVFCLIKEEFVCEAVSALRKEFSLHKRAIQLDLSKISGA